MRKTAINHTDLLYVTAQSGKGTLLTLTISGANDMGDVMRRVRCETPGDAGLVTVSVRNRTQGWSLEQRMVLKTPQTRPAQAVGEYPRLFA
ncbi:MAG: hypothetical protein K2K92_09080 [Duncaniella sp.]|nr:hypothetical protein [Duncaniella sp.]